MGRVFFNESLTIISGGTFSTSRILAGGGCAEVTVISGSTVVLISKITA